jgi:hypothetical protein
VEFQRLGGMEVRSVAAGPSSGTPPPPPTRDGDGGGTSDDELPPLAKAVVVLTTNSNLGRTDLPHPRRETLMSPPSSDPHQVLGRNGAGEQEFGTYPNTGND